MVNGVKLPSCHRWTCSLGDKSSCLDGDRQQPLWYRQLILEHSGTHGGEVLLVSFLRKVCVYLYVSSCVVTSEVTLACVPDQG